MYGGLHEPIQTLFDSPLRKASPPETKAITLPWILFPIYIPLLLTAAGLSIPITAIQRHRRMQRERRFAARMQSAGRAISSDEVLIRIEENRGTLVWDTRSFNGPSRFWWSPEDIAALSPHPYCRYFESGDRVCYEEDFRPFGKWFANKYVDQEAGKGLLVIVADSDRQRFWARVKSLNFITAYTPRDSARGGSSISR